MSPNTYTYAYSRAEILVDQVDILFSEAGIDEGRRGPVCDAVTERWLDAVGLFLERNDERVYEIEATISWSAHSDQAELSFSTDLPGWDGTASPEALILGRRFAKVAADESLVPRFWVRFIPSIRQNPAQHQQLCAKVGVVYGGSLPDWKRTPDSRSFPLQDLREVGLTVRDAL